MHRIFVISVVFCSLFVVRSSSFAIHENTDVEINILPKYDNDVILHRDRRDIVAWMQQRINNTINNLIDAANRINNVTSGISENLNQAVTGALETINNVTQKFIADLEKVVANVTGSTAAIGALTLECIRNNQDTANQLVEDTRNELKLCLEEINSDISELITNGSLLAESAKQMMDLLSEEAQNCFVINSTVQLAPCLITIVSENIAPASSLVNEITLHIAKSVWTAGFAPFRISRCVSSATSNFASQMGQIISSIPKCVTDQTSG